MVWDAGLNFAPATWQNAQLSGGSIFEWHTRQSAICGMLILLTWSESSNPRWQAAHGFVPFKCRRISPGFPRYVPLSMAAAVVFAIYGVQVLAHVV